jgi:hypothetical protein
MAEITRADNGAAPSQRSFLTVGAALSASAARKQPLSISSPYVGTDGHRRCDGRRLPS